MSKAKQERFTERIVTLVTPDFKERYTAMCEAIDENVSEHIRQNWIMELDLYEENKVADAAN